MIANVKYTGIENGKNYITAFQGYYQLPLDFSIELGKEKKDYFILEENQTKFLTFFEGETGRQLIFQMQNVEFEEGENVKIRNMNTGESIETATGDKYCRIALLPSTWLTGEFMMRIVLERIDKEYIYYIYAKCLQLQAEEGSRKNIVVKEKNLEVKIDIDFPESITGAKMIIMQKGMAPSEVFATSIMLGKNYAMLSFPISNLQAGNNYCYFSISFPFGTRKSFVYNIYKEI